MFVSDNFIIFGDAVHYCFEHFSVFDNLKQSRFHDVTEEKFDQFFYDIIKHANEEYPTNSQKYPDQSNWNWQTIEQHFGCLDYKYDHAKIDTILLGTRNTEILTNLCSIKNTGERSIFNCPSLHMNKAFAKLIEENGLDSLLPDLNCQVNFIRTIRNHYCAVSVESLYHVLLNNIEQYKDGLRSKEEMKNILLALLDCEHFIGNLDYNQYEMVFDCLNDMESNPNNDLYFPKYFCLNPYSFWTSFIPEKHIWHLLHDTNILRFLLLSHIIESYSAVTDKPSLMSLKYLSDKQKQFIIDRIIYSEYDNQLSCFVYSSEEYEALIQNILIDNVAYNNGSSNFFTDKQVEQIVNFVIHSSSCSRNMINDLFENIGKRIP